MKNLFILVASLLLSIGSVSAQKLVIGSEVDGHKEVTSLEWLSDKPADKSVWIIDFFATNNPTSTDFYDKHLPEVLKVIDGDAKIVVLTTKSTPEFQELAKKDGDKYSFAVDTKGELYKLFGVRYIPFTVIVNHKGKILWQGNLSSLTQDIANKVL